MHLQGVSLPEVFGLTIDEVFNLFGQDERLRRPLQAARDVGLGYLGLRQPGHALSGGEAQRLKIADELSRKVPAGTLYLLDEPSIGQHLEDVLRLAGVLHRLVAEGGSVLVVEHHVHLLAACDWLVELGPVGGPEGGHVIASGTPEQLAAGNTPTAPYLRQVFRKSSLIQWKSRRQGMTWLPLLLTDPSPCLRWLVLRDLFHRPADDPELLELAALRETDGRAGRGSGPAASGRFLAGRRAGPGSRRRQPHLMTAFALARLGYLGFDGEHPAVATRRRIPLLPPAGGWLLALIRRTGPDRRQQ